MNLQIREETRETKVDGMIISLVFVFAVLSVLSIASATQSNVTGHANYFYTRQIIWYGVGSLAGFAAARMDYHELLKRWQWLYVLGVGMLALIFVWGTVRHGANSWFNFGPFKFEPAEFMKLILILSLAKWFAGDGDEPNRQRRSLDQVQDLGVPIGLFLLPCLLVLLQPDLGMAFMMSGIVAGILFVAGIQLRHTLLLLGLIAVFVTALALIYHFRQSLFFHIIQPYQWSRLTSFLNPEAEKNAAGYQVYQSMLAIGGGEAFGEGLFQGSQVQGGWIPEGHTDFIFAVFSEETGFVGAGCLLALYGILLYRMARIAANARDLEGALIVSGVISMFLAQIFENIGMTVSLMPITGITLPLMSYGGSSILTTLISIGLVLGIGSRSRKGWFTG